MLPFICLQPDTSSASATILLIHGACTTPRVWLPVAHRLVDSGYQVLIPALPGHSAAKEEFPDFTLEITSAQLEILVRQHAIDQRVHLVGHSLGAHVALHFASRQPHLMATLLVSGVADLNYNKFWSSVIPLGFWALIKIESSIPKSWWQSKPVLPQQSKLDDPAWVTQFPDLPMSRKLSEETIAALKFEAIDGAYTIRIPTLVIAATKGVMGFPSDSVSVVSNLIRKIKACSSESRGVSISTKSHPWNEEDPILFADTIVAWVGRREVLPDFEPV